MKHFWKGLLVALAAALVFAGCSREVSEEKDIPISDITEKLLSDLTWVDTPLIPAPNMEYFSKLYGFDQMDLESYEVYIGFSNSTAEEIAVVKLNDKKDLPAVEEAMQKRVDTKKNEVENYKPEEVYKLENAVITSHGRYAALIVCDEFDKADEVFESCFQ